jgi:hypothetical protein
MAHRAVPSLLFVALPIALTALSACGSSSRLIQDNLTGADEIVAVELGTVSFDYARWTNPDKAEHEVARVNEGAWCKTLGDAFLARAYRRGLGGVEHRTRVDITIVDLDPGDREKRESFALGEGAGTVTALVEPRGHGSFRMNGKISGGLAGGDFANVMEKLGAEIADHLAKRARR